MRRLLVALELRDEVLGEAREHGCDAVLTHHPPIFPSLAAVTDGAAAGELVLRAAEDARRGDRRPHQPRPGHAAASTT